MSMYDPAVAEGYARQQEQEAAYHADEMATERAKLDSAYRIAQLSASNAAEANRITAAYNKAKLALDAKELKLKAAQQRIGVSETLAKMSGPENVFDQMAFLRGVNRTGDLPPAYKAMAAGLTLPSFSRTAGPTARTAPVPVEQQGIYQALQSEAKPKQGAGGISDVLRAATNARSPLGRLPADTDRVRAFARQQGMLGAQRWGPQALESMLPDEQAAFWAALGKEGFSVPSLKELYLRSRFGNDQSPLLA